MKQTQKQISKLNHEVLACYATGDLEKGNQIAKDIERAESTQHNKPRR